MSLGFAAITETKPVIAFIGLGSNLGDPAAQVRRALTGLAALDEVELVRVSGFYLNPPLGPAKQPWYVNAVAQVRTRLTAEELLRVLARLEAAADRPGPAAVRRRDRLHPGTGPAPSGDAPAGLCFGAPGRDRPGCLAPGAPEERRPAPGGAFACGPAGGKTHVV